MQPSVRRYDYGRAMEVASYKTADMGNMSFQFLRRGSFFDSIQEVRLLNTLGLCCRSASVRTVYLASFLCVKLAR